LKGLRNALTDKELRRPFFVCPSHWDKYWDKLEEFIGLMPSMGRRFSRAMGGCPFDQAC
jgi:hypothetical protein